MPSVPSARWNAKLALDRVPKPVFVLVVEDAPACWSTRAIRPRSDGGPSIFDSAEHPLVAGALTVKSFGGSRVYPSEGRYSIGDLVATMQDQAGHLTRWVGTEVAETRTFARPVTLWIGAAELPEELYQPTWSGYVQEIGTDDGCATYELKALSLLAAWDQQIMTAASQVRGTVRGIKDLSLEEPNTVYFQLGSFLGNTDLSAADGYYVGFKLKFTSGENEGEEFEVTDYRGASRRITVSPNPPHSVAENDGFTVYNYVKIVGNPIDIFVRILLDDFALEGDVQDDWPLDSVDGVTPDGLGLPAELLDVAQIQAERDLWTRGMKLRLQWSQPEQARACFEQQIFRILGAYPIVSVDGHLRVRMGRPLGPNAEPFEVIPETFDGFPKWRRLTDQIVTQVKVYGDLNLATGQYQLLTDHKTLDSRYLDTDIHRSKIVEIKSRGIASDLAGQVLADGMADRLLNRFGRGGPEEVQGSGAPRLAFLEAGESVTLTHPHLPDINRGRKGKTREAFEVVQIGLDAAALKPKISLVRFYTSGRPGFIAPDSVAENYSSATDANKEYAYNSPATGKFPDGGLPYLVI